jgi:hypothetical protein
MRSLLSFFVLSKRYFVRRTTVSNTLWLYLFVIAILGLNMASSAEKFLKAVMLASTNSLSG